MKTINPKQPRSRGSVLIVTMCVLAVSAIVLASYFMLVQNQTSSVARSQNWNAIIPVTEAGIEEALALVNKGAPNIITSAWAWTNNVTADGWSSFTNCQTSITRTVSGSNYYTATIDITSGSPVITSIGVVPYTSVPWGTTNAMAGEPFLAAAGVSTTTSMGRKVQVQTVLNTLFSAAVITKSNFNMNGNGATVDSFDSSNPLYSQLGQYNSALHRAYGDVATDSSIVGGVSVGNGNIFGHVKTGPGTAQSAVQIGPNGAVGDIAWQASHSGIQSNYWSGDFNVNIPDVQAPAVGTTSLPAVVSNIVTLSGGNYTIDPSISSNATALSKPLKITGAVTLWVQGSYSPVGITISSSNNASLVLYVGRTNGTGDSTTLAGQNALNAPGYAQNFQFYGLPSLTSLEMHGNAAFVGTIYAPQADATFGGGGNNNSDTSGAIIVKSLTLSGHWNFHYDENLKVNGPNRGWIAKNWTELKYP